MNGPFKKPSVLAIARISTGMRQADLAQAIGRSPTFVFRIEHGGPAKITPEVRGRVAAALGMPPAVLFPEKPGNER